MRAVLRRAALLMTASAGAGVLAAGMVAAAAGPAAAAGQQLYAYAGGTASPSGCPQDTTSNPSNECSFSAALTQANAGDTIYLATPGGDTATSRYVGNWTVTTATSATNPVTIEAAPGLSSQPVLDGDGVYALSGETCSTAACDGPVLTVGSGYFVVLSGITIADGYNTSTSELAGGGALDNYGTVIITGCTFTGNRALNNGGAIDNGGGNYGGSVTVTDSTFTDNAANDFGGAIDSGYLGGYSTVVTVTGSTFSSNGATAGGAIDIFGGSMTVTGSTFSSNSAYYGGAIDNGRFGGGGSVSVTGSTFSSNSAADGGAIDNGDQGGGSVSVTGSTFSSNHADYGGAIDSGDNNGGGSVSVTASTFSSNSATDGGAIDSGDLGGGSVSVTGSTFSGNTGFSGSAGEPSGAIDNGDNAGTGSAPGNGTVQVAGDVFDGSCYQPGGTWIDGGYNTGSDGTCLGSGPGDVNAGSSAALGLGSLADNGGPTQTIMPAAGSAVIGIIPDPTTITLGSTQVALCPATDQRGYSSASGTACDAGAVQTTGTPPALTTTAHPKSVTLGTTAPVLTDSADLSGGINPGGTITFTLDDPSGTVVYTDHVTVSGNGTYTTAAGDNPGGYTLATTGTVTGTYTWHAAYSGDSANNPLSDQGGAAEKTTVSPASPAITTTPGNTVVTGTALSDSAALSGGYSPGGTITFTLDNPGNNAVYTDHVTVSGNGTYTTAAGDNPGGYTPTAAGTYQWTATYNGDGNNDTASESGEQQTALYGFGGFMPKMTKETYKAGSTIVAKFRLTNNTGQPIAASTAAALGTAGDVQVTLTGGSLSQTAPCTWNVTGEYFQCRIKTPTGVTTGTAYQITAYENVGAGFVQAPAVGTAVNPEKVYFK
jgi:predicted outer membrane repeat protein